MVAALRKLGVMADPLRELRRPVVLAAFEGWNDAADAATEVINHLSISYPTEDAWALDSDDYYDLQLTRPRVEIGESGREIHWPTTQVAVCHLPERDLVLVWGPEPNLRWRGFANALVSCFLSVEPEYVIVLGAMLTECPHTRALPVSATSPDPVLALSLGLASPSYEGPTGIAGVLADACYRSGKLPTISLWASVPHYVSTAPNPMATLALLAEIGDLLDLELQQGELPVLARRWQENVNELTCDDPDIAEYVAGLEVEQDSDLEAGAGDAIAAEIQRYLRRRQR